MKLNKNELDIIICYYSDKLEKLMNRLDALNGEYREFINASIDDDLIDIQIERVRTEMDNVSSRLMEFEELRRES